MVLLVQILGSLNFEQNLTKYDNDDVADETTGTEVRAGRASAREGSTAHAWHAIYPIPAMEQSEAQHRVGRSVDQTGRERERERERERGWRLWREGHGAGICSVFTAMWPGPAARHQAWLMLLHGLAWPSWTAGAPWL